jgi:hypothetical protein
VQKAAGANVTLFSVLKEISKESPAGTNFCIYVKRKRKEFFLHIYRNFEREPCWYLISVYM